MECAVRELKTPLVEKILAVDSTTESQVQAWAEVLAHELNHRSRACLDGHIACRVFQVSRQNRNVLISAKLKCPNLSKVESCAFRSLAANRRSP
jgi:hypothetical protein